MSLHRLLLQALTSWAIGIWARKGYTQGILHNTGLLLPSQLLVFGTWRPTIQDPSGKLLLVSAAHVSRSLPASFLIFSLRAPAHRLPPPFLFLLCSSPSPTHSFPPITLCFLIDIFKIYCGNKYITKFSILIIFSHEVQWH